MGRHAHLGEQAVRHVGGDAVAERPFALGIGREDGLDLRPRHAGRDEAIDELAQTELATMPGVEIEEHGAVVAPAAQ